ncbi:MAG: carbon-nitrogen hydrolase family protein [Bacteroidia bacterium]|nr:carbon-nitrogen hydrolase family protein [Bacteroidia bacterium]
MKKETLKVALCQMASVFLDKKATLEKVSTYVEKAARQGAELAVFGEALVPAYPFWTEWTDGASFNSEIQKDIYATYLHEGVQIHRGDLDGLCQLAADKKIAIYLGTMERPASRGNHSLYCSLVYIDQKGNIGSVHRKLMPTYEERLVWATGDGHGLRVHDLGPFTVGGLNCWENWMPLPRASLYGQGENLHVAVWPGNIRNTEGITRFIAEESRSFVLSVCGIMRKSDIPNHMPQHELWSSKAPDWMANGGSCIAGPDGKWIIEPQAEKEDVFLAELDYRMVRKERQNFDPSGHYSRPDVVELHLNRKRQSILSIED